MRRFLLLASLVFVVIFSSGFTPQAWRESIYETIKTETIKGLEANFNSEVSIGRVEGLVLGQITFHDVVFGSFAQAKKIDLTYNPLIFAAKKDIVPAITNITISNGNFFIERNKQAQLNVLNLLPNTPKNPDQPPPPVFKAKIKLENCQVKYIDKKGFGQNSKDFSQLMRNVGGEISFAKKDQINYNISGQLYEIIRNTKVSLAGRFNFKTNDYQVNLLAKKADVKKWLDYVTPQLPIKAQAGSADVQLKISPPKTKGWPVKLFANFKLHEAKATLAEYQLKKVNGNIRLIDETITFNNLNMSLNNLDLQLNGELFDFSRLKINTKLSSTNFSLAQAAKLLNQQGKISLTGQANTELEITGLLAQPNVSGQVYVKNGIIYGQKFSGPLKLSFKNNKLKVSSQKLTAYKGLIKGEANLDFSRPKPFISLAVNLGALNLNSLAQGSPGIAGFGSGKLTLKGSTNNLEGQLESELSQAEILGQDFSSLSSSFAIKDGDIVINNFSTYSESGSIEALGLISQAQNFSFQAKAQGIKLKGFGLLGTMEAQVESFKGQIGFKLNKAFLAAPLKNLNASGEVRLGQGKIGEQLFSQAAGKVELKQGQIIVRETFIKQQETSIYLDGQTGLGTETNLKIESSKINLADLKILNYILPKEFADPSGQASLKTTITGKLANLSELNSILNLNAQGKIELEQAKIADIPIVVALINFNWQDQVLSLPNCKIQTDDSQLNINLKRLANQKIDGQVSGSFDLSYLNNFTTQYGRFAGRAGIYLKIKGESNNPRIVGSLWLNQAQFNKIKFETIKGGFDFFDNKLEILQPIELVQNKTDQYSLTGSIQPEDSRLVLAIKKASLKNLNRLAEQVYLEIQRQTKYLPANNKIAKITLPVVEIVPLEKRGTKLFSNNQKQGSFLKQWQKIVTTASAEALILPRADLSGKVSGQIRIRTQKTQIGFDLAVDRGSYNSFNFDYLNVQGSFQNNRLVFSNLSLKKNRGQLQAKGSYDTTGPIALDFEARNFPLEVLQLYFDKNFAGRFDLNASIRGNPKKPIVALNAYGKNLTLTNKTFDSLSLELSSQDNQLNIKEFVLVDGQDKSFLHGSIPLNTKGKLKLKVRAKNNALALLNLFTNDVGWIKGKALALVSFEGTIAQPKINGQLKVENSSLYVKALLSSLEQINGSASIVNNKVKIANLSATWQGERTKGEKNSFKLAGNLQLGKLLSQKQLGLELNLEPTKITADLPKIYNGEIYIKKLKLAGPLNFDFKKNIGPTLEGQAEIENALISLKPQASQQENRLPLNYNLALKLKKNVYATMGDVDNFDLSNIFMNIQIKSDEIKLRGSLKRPDLAGKIEIERGTITLFNREFEILKPIEQETFYSSSQDNVSDNTATFSEDKANAGLAPNINVTAKVEVENWEKDALTNQSTRKKVIIISHFSGVIGSRDKTKGLKINFDSFVEDKTQAPPTLVPASYSQQEIRVMLLPDFIKSVAGIDNQSQVESNEIVADYLSSRLQTYIFRSLERDLEQKLGLESLTLEYNFGKDIRSAMGVNEKRTYLEDKPDWRVGFVKGFFDRLYVDVRYSYYGEEEQLSYEQAAFKYQLTYKLSPIWSIIYYREPASFQELASGYQKATLKLGFSFW